MVVESRGTCDVLVIGTGIAGISAAIEAARCGASVVLTSSAAVFSGASFFPGTWGLGLIGPEGAADEADLAESILRVGCGVAVPEIVKTFVHHINPAIDDLNARGVQLRTAEKSEEQEFIPCFDHKRRNWNGLEADSMRAVFTRELEAYGVKLCPYCEALELIQTDGRVCGAVFAEKNRIFAIRSKAVILATGGYGGLFQNCLTTTDVAGAGQALALRAGVCLINMEFMQMMPGFISPAPKTVFNEKIFRFASFSDERGHDIFADLSDAAELLRQRSTHGPFTSAGRDRAIDFAIAQAERSGGAYVRYADEMKRSPPEFIKTYFDWLREKKGVTPDDAVRVGIYAHAANGGIAIDSNASAGVAGLYACGEVTGGMHGADRIGGLSSANGLVFGKIAGKSAAMDADTRTIRDEKIMLTPYSAADCRANCAMLRTMMTANAMLLRNEEGLNRAIRFCTETLEEIGQSPAYAADVRSVIDSYRLSAHLVTALAVLQAALLRRESRGAHYRADHPDIDPSAGKRICIIAQGGVVKAAYEEQNT